MSKVISNRFSPILLPDHTHCGNHRYDSTMQDHGLGCAKRSYSAAFRSRCQCSNYSGSNPSNAASASTGRKISTLNGAESDAATTIPSPDSLWSNTPASTRARVAA